ncbi:hypothetical protein [Capnocytophaga catalasegens]|uniref:Lipoprotein n=1 Tax=Capnocytophaga catalasegens TaxID=1004260 RepID=A0AAV5AV73_9FLAO|nr:hypothetical protein [Capnocytophaga catalasegens]GIZ15242.1 hypothetical protein RCZ03_12420 [Capnocytophaga catalasegens]GJM49756.1 hypothetical protein RCZ15_07310 [Capnocytophaga catalasegens]GJM52821.1 hypothetical protein RCZ16_11380 [Capnocytophaga catalasegens]
MKRKLFYISLLLLTCRFYTFGGIFSEKAKSIDEFVPKGWELILTKTGDLNHDKLEDAVLIIEKNDKNNIRKNDFLGPEYLNLNPRVLLVLFKQKDNSYLLADKNDKGFIESQGNIDTPALLDPLENDNIYIEKNCLKIKFHYFFSAGSWSVTNITYTFKFQNNTFKLIGLDSDTFMRNSGEEEMFSVNFLTNKIKITTGKNMFDDTENKPKVSWKKNIIKKEYILSEMSKNTIDEITNYIY